MSISGITSCRSNYTVPLLRLRYNFNTIMNFSNEYVSKLFITSINETQIYSCSITGMLMATISALIFSFFSLQKLNQSLTVKFVSQPSVLSYYRCRRPIIVGNKHYRRLVVDNTNYRSLYRLILRARFFICFRWNYIVGNSYQRLYRPVNNRR